MAWSSISQESRESLAQHITRADRRRASHGPGELGKCLPDVTHPLVNCQEHTPVEDFIAVVDAKKYNSLRQLLLISGYVLSFIGNLKAKLSGNTNRVVQELSVTEAKQAKWYWIRTIQASSFEDEIKFLKKEISVITPTKSQVVWIVPR